MNGFDKFNVVLKYKTVYVVQMFSGKMFKCCNMNRWFEIFMMFVQNQLVQYRVFGHPMSLANLEVLEVDSPKHCLTLIERTQLQQRIKMYTLQTHSKEERVSQF